MNLIFTGPGDVHDVYGKLRFDAHGLEKIGPTAGLPGMIWPCPRPRPDGSYEVFGSRGGRDKPFQIVRCRTIDGVTYEGAEVVYESRPGRWVTHAPGTYNPQDDMVISWHMESDPPSHGLYGYATNDGQSWRLLSDKPVFHDHDAFTIRWDIRTRQYIAYQNTMQKKMRRYGDNIGDQLCRVLTMRTSPDGIHWTPDLAAGYYGGLHHAADSIITPDENDPVDMQFYMFHTFPYADRFVGMMLNYAPCPQIVNPSYPRNPHGPQMSAEWWVSNDGFKWDRPYRDVFAPGVAPMFIRHEPMRIRGKLMWIMGEHVYGLPELGIFHVSSLCNAEFSTNSFTMPDTPLVLRASLSVLGGNHSWENQAYIMAELQDDKGHTIAGYEREQCIIQRMTGPTEVLHWGDKLGNALAGQQVRLRLHFRYARIYAVNLTDAPPLP